MQNKKTAEIIKAVRNMTDYEADILEVFISGLRAGKQISGQGNRDEPGISRAAKRKRPRPRKRTMQKQ